MPVSVRLDLDTLVYQPVEAELCSLQGSAHRTRNDGHILDATAGTCGCGCVIAVPPEREEVGEAVEEALAERLALVDALVGEGRVWDLGVLCEVVAGLGVADEDDGWRHDLFPLVSLGLSFFFFYLVCQTMGEEAEEDG